MLTNPSMALSHRRQKWIIVTLLCISFIVGMTVDLIAPSLPYMAHSLAATTGLTKNIITTYLIGYALGNFFTGFLTDAWGRKQLLRLSILGFSLVSLIPIFSPTIDTVLWSRFLQGLTIGSCSVLVRAIFSDIIPVEKLTRLGTVMGTIWGLGPVIGPVIGGYLQFYFGWQACFYFFSLLSGLLFMVIFVLVPETHGNRQPLHMLTIKKNMASVLSHKNFMALVLLMGLAYSLIISFNISAPFLIQTTLHYSPVFFGHFAFYMGLFFLAATFVSRFLLKTYPVNTIFKSAIPLFLALSLFAVALSYYFINNILLIALASGCMFFMTGLVFPMSMGKGLSLFRPIAGTAAATMYLLNMLITSLVAFAMSFMHWQSASAMLWFYVFLLLACLLVYGCLIHEKTITSKSIAAY